jgi:YVTN family beta-propeller protein
LAGVRGHLLVASGAYFQGPYFGNHVRFFFTRDGVSYVATLHTFGNKATTDLLTRIVASLRPTDDLKSRAQRRPSRFELDLGRVGLTALAAANKDVWVVAAGNAVFSYPGNYASPGLFRIDQRTGRLLSVTRVLTPHGNIALGFGSVWVPSYQPGHGGFVVRVDQTSGEVTAKIRGGQWPRSLVVDNKGVWVVNSAPFFRAGSLQLIDPHTSRSVGSPIALGPASAGAAVANGAIWIADAKANVVSRVDERSRKIVDNIRVGRSPFGVTAAAGSLWVTNTEDDTVTRIDPRTGRVLATIPVGHKPYGIAGDKTSIWVANFGGGGLTCITARGGHPRTVPISTTDPIAVVLHHNEIWVISESDGTLTRLETHGSCAIR